MTVDASFIADMPITKHMLWKASIIDKSKQKATLMGHYLCNL